MAADHPSDGIESAPSPAVSSLRSRFEKLAADSSAAPSTPSPSLKPSGPVHHLAAVPPSPRLKPLLHPDPDHPSPEPRSPLLRPASSTSDLKAATKRPPPPPPVRPSSRAPSPANVRVSPLVRPVPDSSSGSTPEHQPLSEPASVLAKPSPAIRRPPPPPPPVHDHSATKNTAVSSLIKQFGNAVPPSPPIPSAKPLVPVGRPSQVLADAAHAAPEPPYSRRPRQSFPPESEIPPSSPRKIPASISTPFLTVSPEGHDPFDDVHSDSEVVHASSQPSPPPPLPSRKLNGHGGGFLHTPESSSESSSPSSSASSSRTSSESDVNVIKPPQSSPHPPSSPRPSLVPPPRPPPRHKSSLQSANLVPSSPASTSASSLAPPPLPARKGVTPPVEEQLSRHPPSRHHSMTEQEADSLSESPQANQPDRKVFGSFLPPPTRTIALGDKLPPARHNQSGSSSESDDEEDSKIKVEQLPDASRASRRPPVVDCHNYSEFDIHVPAYTGYVTVSGHIVAVASHHHLRIYDLSVSAVPIWNLDSKDGFGTKVRDFKITALEFRPTSTHDDRGNFLWLGTKDGHLIEVDVRTGTVTAMRPAIHAHTVTHMFRHGQSMISMDDTGKVLVFTPPEGHDLDLRSLQPRVVRVAEKQEFAKLLGGQLWTSTRDPNGGGSVPGTSRGPYVRVYDVFTPGAVGRSVLPTEHLGAITAGTVLASQPGQVYLAHEGGHISIWALGDTEGAPPQCVEVVKVSASDVLSLEGVNDRLWAGSRKGLISAYDVTSKPWTVTNCWEAHNKLPVLRIAVDTWSMEKLDRLVVYSVGRDEQLRFWDGLLGIDWIEQELLKRETEFSTFRDMTVLIVSWNVDSAKPDALTGTPENVNFLTDVLTSVDRPDVIAFGMQELIDLESRKLAAKTVLLGGKGKTADGTISQKVTTSYKKWYDRLVLAVRCAMPADSPYTVIHTENLVGLFTCVFVKNTEKIRLKHVALTTVKRGMGGRYGNKGGIISRFVVDDTSVCFINCHLAAGQRHVRQRNADVQAIVEDNTLLAEAGPSNEPVAYVNGGDGSMVLDHEIVFMNGDMNYRIDQRREAVIAAVKAGDLEHLVIHDQLRKEMKFNRGFRLRTFSEGPLTFAPTYKYDRRSDEYDTSEKARTPAWCDRVLWRSLVPERVQQIHYRRWEPNVSDHRPISAAFKITVKQVNHELRARVKAQTLERWKAVERERLSAALQHYIDQQMI